MLCIIKTEPLLQYLKSYHRRVFDLWKVKTLMGVTLDLYVYILYPLSSIPKI